MPKLKLTRSVLLPVEGSNESREAHAGEEVTVNDQISERLLRIGAAEKAGRGSRSED